MKEGARIYQTFYKNSQKRFLDASLEPLDVSTNTAPHLREYPVYFDMYKKGVYREQEYTGLFSYKFNVKSRLTGNQVLDFIDSNPGYDVYLFNPYPQIAYFAFNIWEQGEYFHAGITETAAELLERIGLGALVARHGRDTEEHLLFCNFWVGNQKFWDTYMPFLMQLHEAIVHDVDGKRRSRYLRPTFYFTESPMYPFLLERMLTTFLKSEQAKGLRVLAYKREIEGVLECCTTDVEREVVRQVYGLIHEWDRKGVYSEEQRAIFRALLAATGEHEKLLMKTGIHPYLF